MIDENPNARNSAMVAARRRWGVSQVMCWAWSQERAPLAPAAAAITHPAHMLVEASAARTSPPGLVGAVFAGAVEDDFVFGDAHRNVAAEFQDRGLKVGVGEGGDGAAVVADEVVVVAFAGADRFVAGHRLSDLELLDEVEAFEFVEDAVDAGAADRSLALAERVFDLDRGEGAGLGVEQFEQ